MHFPILTVLTTLLATTASIASAWQINLYEYENYNAGKPDGIIRSFAGPGNPGWKCHSVKDLNNKISSLKWWPGPNRECELHLFGELYCPQDTLKYLKVPNVQAETNWPKLRVLWTEKMPKEDDVSSFMTICKKPKAVKVVKAASRKKAAA
jgi:hypothetical protein